MPAALRISKENPAPSVQRVDRVPCLLSRLVAAIRSQRTLPPESGWAVRSFPVVPEFPIDAPLAKPQAIPVVQRPGSCPGSVQDDSPRLRVGSNRSEYRWPTMSPVGESKIRQPERMLLACRRALVDRFVQLPRTAGSESRSHCSPLPTCKGSPIAQPTADHP